MGNHRTYCPTGDTFESERVSANHHIGETGISQGLTFLGKPEFMVTLSRGKVL